MIRSVAAILVLALALPLTVHAAGLSAAIDAYVEVLDARRALGSCPGVRSDNPRYVELCRREAAALAPLREVAAGSDDVARIVRAELARRVSALDVAAAVATEPQPMEALAGEDGAILRVAPRHDAAPVGAAPAFAILRVTGRAGDWYQLVAPSGVRAYAHGSLVDVDLDTEPGAEIPAGYKRISDQKPTYYNTAREQGFPTSGPLHGQTYNGTERKKILTVSGEVIAETSGRFFASLAMEGSGILADGRGVSFVSNQRFQVLPAGCKGITATGRWVVPFHTMAVNKREMPYLGVYFLPSSQGLALPNGETHDGFWFAHDTGSAFTGTPKHRIDLYSDQAAWVTWMELNHAPSHSTVKAYRVDAATAKLVYDKYKDQLGLPATTR